jgi:hypothetical protein
MIDAGRPFIFRWGWNPSGGHFLVMYGYSDSTVYYMNPWMGEGKKIARYDWVVKDSDHTWTHTLSISEINPVNETPTADITISPNPASNEISISSIGEFFGGTLEIINQLGTVQISQAINAGSVSSVSISGLPAGAYLLRLSNSGKTLTRMFIKAD